MYGNRFQPDRQPGKAAKTRHARHCLILTLRPEPKTYADDHSTLFRHGTSLEAVQQAFHSRQVSVTLGSRAGDKGRDAVPPKQVLTSHDVVSVSTT